MTVNFVLCNASLELHRDRSFKRRSLPQSFTLLTEEDHYRESDQPEEPEEPEDEEDGDEDDAERKAGSGRRGARFRRRNWKEVRPDILHFCLMALHDSILNKEGRLCIWIHTLSGQLYRVYPEFRIPRTFKVFNKVMAKYLHSNASCLKPEGDDSTVLMERVESRFEDLGTGCTRVAVSSRGGLSCAETFFAQPEVSGRLDELWIYISLSMYSPLPVPDESGIVCVADLHKRLLDRQSSTPSSSTHSQDLERKLLAGEPVLPKPSIEFEYNISISDSFPTAMSTCYKLMCALERVLDL